MLLRISALRYLAIASLAIASGTGVVQAADKAAVEQAKKSARETQIEEANRQAKELIADSEKLRKQYAEASEEQKKVIREKLEERKKALEELTAGIARQLRDEQRKLRNEAAKKR